MDNILFGEIIKNRREELNISQDELCEGILDRTALSRIENGKAECRKYVAELLLDRLGLPMEFYYSSDNKNSIEQIKYKNQISELIRMRKYEELESTLAEAEKLIDDNKPCEQFLLRSKATYFLRVKKDRQKARELLYCAVSVMHPDFCLDNFEKLYLFKEDILVLNVLANTFVEDNDDFTAIEIFKKLIDRIKSNPNLEKDDSYSKILIMLKYNLSRSLGRTNQFLECLNVANEAISMCMNAGTMIQMAELLINKGYALCSIFKKEEDTLVLKDALTLNRLLGLNQNVKTIYKDAKELFNIDLHKS